MTEARGGAKGTYAFAAASLAVGLFNYLFQVHAAAVLDAAAFGELSAWLAQVAIASAVGTVVQYVSLDFPAPEPRLVMGFRAALVVAIAVVVTHVFVWTTAPRLWLGALAVLGPVGLCVWNGQLQARLRLAEVAGVVLLTSVVRFAFPFVGLLERDRTRAFYVAQAIAAFSAIAVFAPVALVRGTKASEVPARAEAHDVWLRLRRPFLLGFANVLFPAIDVLVVSLTTDAATTGAFSRAALPSRVALYAGVALLQAILPYQLHAEPMPTFARRLERLVAPGAFVGALLTAAAADVLIFHEAGGDARTWLYLAAVITAVLLSTMGAIQRLAAKGSIRAAALVVLGVCVASAGSAALASGSVTRYLTFAAAGYAVVFACAAAARRLSQPDPG